MKEKLEHTLVGVAGEYLVAGELSLRGYIASITLRNSRGMDILVSNSEGTKSISVQVKTNSSGAKQWMLNKKAEEIHSKNHYYILVALGELNERPSFHIVPSKVVADRLVRTHTEWINGTKKDGTERKDTSMRIFTDRPGEYLEAWHRIKL